MTKFARLPSEYRQEARGEASEHLEALGWAFTHRPTQEAYRRSQGDLVAPVLDRYRSWVEENIIGRST